MATQEQIVAVDTNVLVCLFVENDVNQTRRARKSVKGKKIYITRSVALESEWVLRHACKIDEKLINDLFVDLLEAENVIFEDRGIVLEAVRGHAEGLDFADAFHVASSENIDVFLTFDQRLASRSPQIYARPLVEMPNN